MSQAKESSLTEDVLGVIARYVDKGQNRSLQTLAQKTGLGHTMMRRMAQGEAEQLTADTIISLIDVALPPSERISFLKKHYPKVGHILEDIYKNQACDDDCDLEQGFLRKSLHSFIFNLAATANGTKVDDIKRLRGEHGLQALEEMVNQDILIQDASNRVRYKTSGWNTTNADLILEQIRFSTEYFHKTLLGTDAARMAHVTASVNAPALKKVHALCTRFFYDLLEIQNDETNQGEIPVFVDMLMNVYDPEKLPES